MNPQAVAFLLAIALAGFVGEWYGRTKSTEHINVGVIERRLREVFCEQAVHNGVLKTCDPTFPRYVQ